MRLVQLGAEGRGEGFPGGFGFWFAFGEVVAGRGFWERDAWIGRWGHVWLVFDVLLPVVFIYFLFLSSGGLCSWGREVDGDF